MLADCADDLIVLCWQLIGFFVITILRYVMGLNPLQKSQGIEIQHGPIEVRRRAYC